MAENKAKKKAGSNAPETTVIARLQNVMKKLKGVVVDITASHLVFIYPRPHTKTFNQKSIPLSTVVYYSGNKGKAGEVVYIDNGDIDKRVGVAEIQSNGFTKLSDTDRNEVPRVTFYNPLYASIEASGLDAPEASTGYASKKSKPKAKVDATKKKKAA